MKLVGALILGEWRQLVRRPLWWFWLLFGLFLAWGMMQGNVSFAGAVSGGLGEEERVHVNGPYSLALYYLVLPYVLYTLFAVVTMAGAVGRDRELGVEEVLRATRLSARQYILGKYTALIGAIVAMTLLLAFTTFGFDQLSSSRAAEGGTSDPRLFGPSHWRYHLQPLLYGTLPWLLFAGSGAYYLGVRVRSTLVAYGTLVLLFVATLFLAQLDFESLRRWSLDRLGVEWKYVLGWIEPSGYSFLDARYASVDRGVAFYNEVVPVPDLGFAIQRVAMLVGAGLFVWRASVAYRRQRHGSLEAANAPPAAEATQVTLPPSLPEGGRRGRASGLLRVFRAELTVLTRQPAVWIFTPLVVLSGTSAALWGQPGVWGSKQMVSSATAAAQLIAELSVWLSCMGCFLIVEAIHRERVTRFGEIFFSAPVRTRDLVIGKVLAVFAILAVMVAVPTLAAAALQAATSTAPVVPASYVQSVTVILLPGLLFFVCLAAFFAVLTRSRTAAYGLLAGFGVLYAVGLLTGWLDWRGRVVPSGLIVFSDAMGLTPFRHELWWNRVLVFSVCAALLLATVHLFPRTDRSFSARLGWLGLRRHKIGLVSFATLLVTAVSAGVVLDSGMDRGPEAEWREDRDEEYARRNRLKWGDRETPEFAALDLRLSLEPARRAFSLQGEFTFVNPTQESFAVLPLSIGWDWDLDHESFAHWIDPAGEGERPLEVERRSGLAEVRLPEELEPGERVTLRLEYGGEVASGVGRSSGGLSHWIRRDAVFLDTFGPVFLPVPGYVEPLTLDQDTLDRDLGPQEMAQYYSRRLPTLLGGRQPFSVRVAVEAPRELTVLSVGRQLERTEDGERATTTYESDHPIYFFPIVAGHYQSRRVGTGEVFYFDVHPQNVEVIATTLDRARRFYSAVFTPYPFEELRIVELPAFAGFALGHPTLIPFSEQLGFLTDGDDGISNTNFMVTAHEVAHQWWGTVITPARAPAAAFLTEALAHFSTLMMEERFQGRVAARNRRRQFESLYLEGRRVDVERAIVRIDGSQAGDQATWYNKGGWVFWMAYEQFGRERFLRLLRQFVDDWAFQVEHPTIHDLLALFWNEADADERDFLNQWFYEVVLPRPRVVGAFTHEIGGRWSTRVTLCNEGSGTVPLVVEVANRRLRSAELGIEPMPNRLESDQLAEALAWEEEVGDSAKVDEDSPYRAVRGTVLLAPGCEEEITLVTEFEPHAVILDPDIELLMLGRGTAFYEW